MSRATRSEDAPPLEPMTPEEFAAFVEAGEWTFAKSMPGIPHEYVVADWPAYRGGDEALRAAAYVRDNGRRGQWPARGRGKYVNAYLEHEMESGARHSYWVLWPIINRADLPLVPQNEVKWLDGPDGEPLEDDRREVKTWMPRNS